jgi:predicted TIM-barrel fold metal-dependent hydrolase
MIDTHIHIGQFFETYYEPQEIYDIVSASGVQEMWFSSTTTCVQDIQYTKVEKEIKSLCDITDANQCNAFPALWYIPDYIAQGVSIEAARNNLPYRGIKLHPKAHKWDFENTAHIDTLHEIFNYAENGKVEYILIHTGEDTVNDTEQFASYFVLYPRAKIILAHCRPLEQTLRLMRQHENVSCDTAFVQKDTGQKIIAAGFAARIHTGSDFPITHYYKTKYPGPSENPCISLAAQYEEDNALLELYAHLIEREEK